MTDWKNWTAVYKPKTAEEHRAHQRQLLKALEYHKFQKPMKRYSPRRLWWLLCDYVKHRAWWNPWRRHRGIPLEIEALFHYGRRVHRQEKEARPSDEGA